MSDSQRRNLHYNIANLLLNITTKIIKIGYLAQLWNINPDYSRAIFELLPDSAKTGAEGFEFIDVQNKAKGAELAGKDPKFCPSLQTERLIGFSPESDIYKV